MMARRLGQSISKTAALVKSGPRKAGNQRQGHGRPRLIDARGELKLLRMGLSSCRPVRVPILTPVHCQKCLRRMNHVFFHITWMAVCVCITGIHYGKKASWLRQCDALGNVLLGNLGSCHSYRCYFDTYHLSIIADRIHTLSWKLYFL